MVRVEKEVAVPQVHRNNGVVEGGQKQSKRLMNQRRICYNLLIGDTEDGSGSARVGICKLPAHARCKVW